MLLTFYLKAMNNIKTFLKKRFLRKNVFESCFHLFHIRYCILALYDFSSLNPYNIFMLAVFSVIVLLGFFINQSYWLRCALGGGVGVGGVVGCRCWVYFLVFFTFRWSSYLSGFCTTGHLPCIRYNGKYMLSSLQSICLFLSVC